MKIDLQALYTILCILIVTILIGSTYSLLTFDGYGRIKVEVTILDITQSANGKELYVETASNGGKTHVETFDKASYSSKQRIGETKKLMLTKHEYYKNYGNYYNNKEVLTQSQIVFSDLKGVIDFFGYIGIIVILFALFMLMIMSS